MKFTHRIYTNFGFWSSTLYFSLVQVFALIVSMLYITRYVEHSEETTQSSGLSGLQFILAILIATAIIIFILKVIKKPVVVKYFFYLAVFEGIWLFGRSFLGSTDSLIFLGFFILFYFLYSNVLIHNIELILSLAALSVFFGLSFAPTTLIWVLLVMTAYDIWAVYKTKHMVTLFKGLEEKKIHMAFLITGSYKDLFIKLKNASKENMFMFLGTGDALLPAMFVVSALQIGLRTSMFTLVGTIVGYILLFTLFSLQELKKPMAGLPPIVGCTFIGFALSFL